MSRILICGCGDVGSALGVRLIEAGHRVWGLRRRVAALPPGIEPLAADLSSDPLPGLPEGLDQVVYCAAANSPDESAYRAAYVEGPRNTVRALRDQGQTPGRVIYVSSTGVYAQDDASPVDEASPTEPLSFRGSTVLEGERLFKGAFPSVAVRFGGIYGPGRTRLIDQVRSGNAALPSPDRWTNRIHRDDCAGVLHHLLEHPDPDPIYIGVDDTPALQSTVLAWIAARLERSLPDAHAPGDSTPVGKRCSNRRLRDSGYTFLHPDFRSGYGPLLPS